MPLPTSKARPRLSALVTAAACCTVLLTVLALLVLVNHLAIDSAAHRQILLLGTALGLGLAIAGALLARRLAHPLKLLSKAIEGRAALAPGSAEAPPIPLLDNFHEIQVLSCALAGMVQREEQQRLALLTLNESLESAVAQRTRDLAQKALLLEQALAQDQYAQQQLRERAGELRAILDNAHDAFIALDSSGVVTDWNMHAEHLLGWRRSEVVGQPLASMILPPLLRRAYEDGMRQLAEHGDAAILNRRIEMTIASRDGVEFPVEVSMAHVPRLSGYVFFAFLHDISERRRLFASLEAMALKDTLTGLPNRRALMQTLGSAMLRASRLRRHCAVFFLDLDGFKQVNDRHGHEEGDELLRQFARRIVDAVRRTDTVGRLAGDEFVVILEMMQDEASAHDTASKLLLPLQQPYTLKTTTVTLTASIGIALHHPDDPADIERLLSRADQAMYQAKQLGKNQAALANHAA